jgi:hypothetical protein
VPDVFGVPNSPPTRFYVHGFWGGDDVDVPLVWAAERSPVLIQSVEELTALLRSAGER